MTESPRAIIDSPGLRIDFVAEADLPTVKGRFKIRAYRDSSSNSEPIALISGTIAPGATEIPVRVHDQCFTSEVMGSLRCDCKKQLEHAMEFIQEHSPGVIIYLHQEGRGIGLANKIRAYALQEMGLDTVEANERLGFGADERQYFCVPHIIRDCGISSIKLMTNNPRKLVHLHELGTDIVGRIPVVTAHSPHSERYMDTKIYRMGHLLNGRKNLTASQVLKCTRKSHDTVSDLDGPQAVCFSKFPNST